MRTVLLVLIGLTLGIVATLALATLRWRREAGVEGEDPELGLPGGRPGFDLAVADPLALTTRMVEVLSGNAHLVVEGGDLEDVELSGIEGATDHVPPPLRRHTIWSIPRENLVLPLEAHTEHPVCSSFLPSLNWDALSHVQIEKDGRLMFGAYDRFEVTWVPDDLGCYAYIAYNDV